MARRLAAIMFTDIAGFTALSQTDEKGALRLLREQEALVLPLLELHRGRQVKSMGDGLLIEFPDALDAVEGAVDIQRHVQERNAREEKGTPLRLRVGIHLGDVEGVGTDILGDAVNIASRIEPLAEPGGICVTEQVYVQVRNKVPYRLAELGRKSLKGVQDRVAVYHVVFAGDSEPVSFPVSAPPRVAVLPLANISPDPKDEYFADGLTEELIGAISKVRGLRVISKTSVMQYKGHEKPIPEIARDLNAGTFLEGSVRKDGNRVRVSIQMIEATKDEHLWSENYDREIQDIFAVQTDIATRVAEALKVELLASEKNDITRPPTENVQAYQLYLRGKYQYARLTRESLALALSLFQEAVAIDPRYALAYAAMAECYHFNCHLQFLQPEEAYPPMKELALRAIEINPRSAEGHGALGAVYFHWDWDWAGAEGELLRAIELNPSFGDCHSTLSWLYQILGREDEGRRYAEQAAALSPEPYKTAARPGAIMWTGAMLIPGDVTENLVYLQKMVEQKPDDAGPHFSLGFACYRASRPDEAIPPLRRALQLSGERPLYRAGLAFILALLGVTGEATALLTTLEEQARSTYVSPVQLAAILFALGRRDEAFARLEEAYRRRASELVDVRRIPELATLREDPRWKSIEHRMGLPGA